MNEEEVKDLLKTIRTDLIKLDTKKHVAGVAALKSLENEVGKQAELESAIDEYKVKVEEQEALVEENAVLLDDSLSRAQLAEEEAARLQKVLVIVAEEKEHLEKIVDKEKKEQRRSSRAKLKEPVEPVVEKISIGERIDKVAIKSDLRRVRTELIGVLEAAEDALPLLQKYADDAASERFVITEADILVVHESIAAALTALETALAEIVT